MVAVFGVGCAGNRILSYMRGRIEAEFVAINTDKYVLDGCQADVKLLIRKPGQQPHVIMEAAGEVAETIAGLCRESVIIVAGLGKGTGTGVAPLVARIAQRQRCKTAAVVTKPLPWEGVHALVYALVAMKMLAGVDRLITVPFVELLYRGVSKADVWRAGDELVARAVERLMVPEGWSAPVKAAGKRKWQRAVVVQGA
jgi:cell division protein FtsZ